MGFVELAQPRFRAQETIDGLEISIPSRKMWAMTFFLGFWLLGWLVGEVLVAVILIGGLIDAVRNGFEPADAPIGLFLLAWLGGWTVGGIVAVRALLWNIAGREVLTVGRGLLRVEHRVPLFHRTKVYDLASVTSLRAMPQPPWPYGFGYPGAWSGWGGWGSGGTLAFDYGVSTVRLGTGLDEAEAKLVVREIGAKHPELLEAQE